MQRKPQLWDGPLAPLHESRSGPLGQLMKGLAFVLLPRQTEESTFQGQNTAQDGRTQPGSVIPDGQKVR